MIKEDQILLNHIGDKVQQRDQNYMMTATGFLDLRQQSLVKRWCMTEHIDRWTLYGGYDDAERKICLFFPDYVPWEEGTDPGREWLVQNPQDDPLVVLRVTHSGQKELTHRDYLGSILNLGIKRDPVGDILVRPDGCDIVVERAMGEFLLHNYLQVGRTSIRREVIDVGQIDVSQIRFEESSDTVASLRLDNLIAAGFRTSRTKAADAIGAGLVFVDGLAVEKPDASVAEGSKLVWRGKGKILLHDVGETTRKGRIFVRFRRYI